MLVLVAAAVLIAIGTAQGHAAVHRLASDQLNQIHERIDQHIETLVGLPARLNQTNIALIRSGVFDPAEPRAWGPVLIEQFRAFQALSAITWGGEDAQCTWVARYSGEDEFLYYAIKDHLTGDQIVEYRVAADGSVADQPSGAFPFDPRTRPWYLAPKNAGRASWSEPFVWVGGGGDDRPTLGIAYGSPYHDDQGQLIGIMDADLSLQDISRYLAGIAIARTGRAYIVDHEGLMLAASTGAPMVDAEGARLHATDSDADWIAASARRLAGAFDAEAGASEDFQTIITIDGVRQWLRASPFVHESGLHWVIVTLVPESDFMSEIAAGRRRSAWFTAGAILGTIGLGFMLASLLVRPTLRLSQHVRRLGEGNLESRIDLPYTRELTRLSDDINQMAGDLRDRMELRRSLAMAMEVQQGLLPSQTPVIDGLDITGYSTYCDETGGDYCDYLDVADVSDSTAAFVVGDVTGHGIAAALLMATARGILRSRCTERGTLGSLLDHLNDLLVEVTGGTRFMTMVIVTIDAQHGDLRLSSAGHDPPFIYNPEKDEFIELTAGGLPLGVVAGERYPEASCGPLPIGSVVLVSTDGVWEAQNSEQQQFGKDRVREIIRANAGRTSGEITQALYDAVQEFCGDARQLDDITFVVVKRTQASA